MSPGPIRQPPTAPSGAPPRRRGRPGACRPRCRRPPNRPGLSGPCPRRPPARRNAPGLECKTKGKCHGLVGQTPSGGQMNKFRSPPFWLRERETTIQGKPHQKEPSVHSTWPRVVGSPGSTAKRASRKTPGHDADCV